MQRKICARTRSGCRWWMGRTCKSTVFRLRKARSTSAQAKAHSKRTKDDLPVHSFQTLLSDLATIVSNRVQPKDASTPAFDILTTPTALQQRALDLLHVSL